MKNLLISNQDNEMIRKIGQLIQRRLDKYELLLVALFIISILLKVAAFEPGEILLTLVLVTMACLYFFSSYGGIQQEQAGDLDTFLHKLLGWGSSVGCIGILFRIQNWEGYGLILLIGAATLAVSFIMLMIRIGKKPNLSAVYYRWIIRIVVMLSLIALLRLVPEESLKKWKLVSDTESIEPREDV